MSEQQNAPTIKETLNLVIEHHQARRLADAENIYQQNRAVLFKSNLFHKSEQIDFKDSFENRRINITMLFGKYGQQNESATAPTKKIISPGKQNG